MLRKLRKRGQNTAEYAILIGLVVAAAVGMQIYVKRGLQARVRGGMEYLVGQTNQITSNTYNMQYEPYYLTSQFNVTQNAQASTTIGNQQTVNATSNAFTTRATGGYQEYGNVSQTQ